MTKQTIASIHWVWVVVLSLTVCIPFRDGFIHGEIVGAGPDVVSTLWGMWWLQQEGVEAVFGVHTQLVNHPYGATGIVLSPTSALMWAILEPLCGTGLALSFVNWIQVLGISLGTMWLARVCGVPSPWHGVAGLSILCARYIFYSTGEASIVAVVAAPLSIGLACWVRALQQAGLKYHLGVIFCSVWLALENPYLATILPLAEVLAFLWHKENRAAWFWTGLFSLCGILTVAHAYSSAANPNYPREVAGQAVYLFNAEWRIVDLPWSRLKLQELITPIDVSWTTSTHNAISAKGGRYFGVVLLLLTLPALRFSTIRWWWLVGCICVTLAMGSEQQEFALPFLFFNEIMAKVARPLTQPSRLLVMSLICFGVCISWTLSVIAEKWGAKWSWGLVCALVLEGFIFGGLGLRPPNTVMPTLDCEIPGEGGVLIWPDDRKDGELGSSRLFQMTHGHPTPQMGIASWKQADQIAMKDLRGAGFSLGSTGWNESKLIQMGYTHILVTERENVDFIRGSRFDSCGDYEVVELSENPCHTCSW